MSFNKSNNLGELRWLSEVRGFCAHWLSFCNTPLNRKHLAKIGNRTGYTLQLLETPAAMPGKSDNEHELKVPVQLQEPQKALDEFWEGHAAKKTGHVRAILPPNALEEYDDDELDGSYSAAKEACVRRVNAIVRQCRTNNEMFTDSTFDLDTDMRNKTWEVLDPLRAGKDCASVGKDNNGAGAKDLSENAPPRAVHRVNWIFSKSEVCGQRQTQKR